MIKKYLLSFSLLAVISVMSAHAAPATGEWIAKFYVDKNGSGDGVYAGTWNVCIQSDGNWYISSTYTGYKGKWFSKGNDTHLQGLHSSGTKANSFDVSRVNDTLLTGYYKSLYGTGMAGYYTVSLIYKAATCPVYVP